MFNYILPKTLVSVHSDATQGTYKWDSSYEGYSKAILRQSYVMQMQKVPATVIKTALPFTDVTKQFSAFLIGH